MAKNALAGANDFKLERYKYILQQLNALNEHTHKYLTLFQTMITAIVSGGIIIFVSWKQLNIEPSLARLGLQAIVFLLIGAGVFVASSIVAGICSWLDYRNEEVRLLIDIVGDGFRKPPEWRNIWRWHELYVLLFLIVITIGLVLFFELWVLPLIE